MTIYVKKNGTYQAAQQIYVKKNGVYQAVTSIYAKQAGLYMPASAPTDVVTIDATTLTEYHAAIGGASKPNKRQAGADAIKLALGATNRLQLLRNGSLALEINCNTLPVVTDDGSDVKITLGAITTTTFNAADIDSGTWTFQFQGGTSYARSISGSAGKVGSTALLKIDRDIASGMGLLVPFQFVLPRSLDL